MMFVFAVFVLATSSVVNGQFLNCPWVNSLDCTSYTSSQECGTDGVTYTNRCYFAKQQCVDLSLHILHDGVCAPAESSTTPAQNFVSGHDAVLDFFCTALSKKDCGTETLEVCGTDGWTYRNYCEYDKARCTHRNLKIRDFGKCI